MTEDEAVNAGETLAKTLLDNAPVEQPDRTAVLGTAVSHIIHEILVTDPASGDLLFELIDQTFNAAAKNVALALFKGFIDAGR